jgi:hypothetical protein
MVAAAKRVVPWVSVLGAVVGVLTWIGTQVRAASKDYTDHKISNASDVARIDARDQATFQSIEHRLSAIEDTLREVAVSCRKP